MINKNVVTVHWSFWVIAAVAFIWNFMGSINYFMQMNPQVLASFPESEQAIVNSRPAWATVAFAISVFGGTLGSLLLLFRKPAAYYLFIASLLGTFVTMIHTVRLAFTTIDFSPMEIAGIILMPLIVAAFLVWYSKLAERKGWIR